jgi:hypothetical protein
MTGQELYEYLLKEAKEAAAKSVEVEVECADLEVSSRYDGLAYAYGHAAGLVQAHLKDDNKAIQGLREKREKDKELEA